MSLTKMPRLSPCAIRWFCMAQAFAAVVLSLALAMFVPTDFFHWNAALILLAPGGVAIFYGSELCMRWWGRHHGNLLLEYQDWITVRNRAMNVWLATFVQCLLFCLALVQVSAGKPAWVFGWRAWAIILTCASAAALIKIQGNQVKKPTP